MASASYPLVDLLQFEPHFRIEPESTDTKLVFSFSGSGAGGLFADTLASADMPASNWEPSAYVHDLFVERFVRDCLQGPRALVTTTHLLRLVASPPRDRRSVEMRRRVLRELSESETFRSSLDKLYQALLRFRAGLEGSGRHDSVSTGRGQLDHS